MKTRLLASKTTKNLSIFCCALLVAVIIMTAPIPHELLNNGTSVLSTEGRNALAVLAFALILWVTEALPFHITGLLGMILLTLLRVGNFKAIVKEGFGSDTAVFFIGVLVLSAFITNSGLGRRISLGVLSLTGNRTSYILLGVLVAGALLSMWITDMAVAAILMSMAVGILENEGLKPMQSNFGRALLMACAWGPTIGGIATPAGCSPNPISVSLLKEMAGIELTFFDWMRYGVPSSLLIIVPSWLILLAVFPPEIRELSHSKEEFKNRYKALPAMSHEEKCTMVIFCITVVLWLSTPVLEKWLEISIPISMPAILAACLFFIPGVSQTKWSVIEKDVAWNSILLVVSGLSIGTMLYQSGAAEWLSLSLLGGLGGLHPLLQIFLMVLLMALLKVVFSSNAVTATVLIPVVISLALNLGINPLVLTLPAAITSSLCFLLVTSSPTNVIPYAAGYFSIKDFAKAGVPMTLVSSVIVTLVIYGIGILNSLY